MRQARRTRGTLHGTSGKGEHAPWRPYCADVKLAASTKGIVPRLHLAIKRMESDRAHAWAAQHLGHWWGSANCSTTGQDPKVALIRLERPPLSILACDSVRFCGLCSL